MAAVTTPPGRAVRAAVRVLRPSRACFAPRIASFLQKTSARSHLKELAVGPVHTIYDTAPHGIGRVASETRWTPIVDASSPRPQPLLRTEFSYDPRGNVTEERRSFNLAPVGIAVSDSRTIFRHYNAVDKLDGMAFYEPKPGGLGIPSVPLAFQFTYDARGLPHQVNMARPSGLALLASHTRNVSGSLLRTDYAVAGNAARARYVYDQLGRVETYDVFAKIGTGAYAHRASQHATYSASDDVLSAVSRVAGTAPRNIAYDYDGRHQLVAASDDQDFSAVYEYGAAGRLTDAHVAATNAPIAHPRTVTYQYRTPGDSVVADLEAPIALLRQDGTARARYDYDRAGNLVRRRVGGAVAADPIDEHTFVYDGDQRQRAASAPNGTRQVDYYDSSGSRALQVLKGSGGVVTRVRLWFGPLEVWYTPAGVAEKQWAHVAHGVSIARVDLHPSVPSLGGIQPDAVVGEPSGVMEPGDTLTILEVGGCNADGTSVDVDGDRYVVKVGVSGGRFWSSREVLAPGSGVRSVVLSESDLPARAE